VALGALLQAQTDLPFDFTTFNDPNVVSTSDVNIIGEDGHVNFFTELEQQVNICAITLMLFMLLPPMARALPTISGWQLMTQVLM